MNRRERRAGQAFARATRDEWHPFERVTDAPPMRVAELAARTGDLVAMYRNNTYAVMVFRRSGCSRYAAWGGLAHDDGTPRECFQLAIRRHDGGEVRGWSDLQRIKQEIAGDGYAVEVYPPAERVVDNANMRHLFVFTPGDEPADLAHLDIGGRWE